MRNTGRPLQTLLVETLLAWLPLAVVTVVLTVTIYAAVQQVERSSANDPQIQMATDAANALSAGATPQSLVSVPPQIDIARSYAPYVVIFDSNKQILAASATVNGNALVPPSGVFDVARRTGMDLITWTPAPGARSAIAVVPYASGYVVAGRSLKLIEDRETSLEYLVGAGGAAALLCSLVAVIIVRVLAMRLTSRGGVSTPS